MRYFIQFDSQNNAVGILKTDGQHGSSLTEVDEETFNQYAPLFGELLEGKSQEAVMGEVAARNDDLQAQLDALLAVTPEVTP